MGTILHLNPETDQEITSKVIEILKNSGTAIVPTDTVYGIVCDGLNDPAKKSIYLIKNRPESKPLIGFINSIEKAEKLAFIPERFLGFIHKRWPGRNTFVFISKTEISFMVDSEKKIALRIPNTSFISHICDSFQILASTSANISFHRSVSSIDRLEPEIIERASITVDGGTIFGQESAIWDMTQDTPRLIRGRILFVCSGNSCRSPMAQAILQQLVSSSIQVISAGTESNFYGSISEEAFCVLKETGMEMDKKFVSKNMTEQMIESSDLIFAMEEKHLERILKMLPDAYDKTFVLNVPDPAGGNIFKYRQIRDIIKERITNFVLTRIKT